MTDDLPPLFLKQRLARVTFLAFAGLIPLSAALPAEPQKKFFDIPAGVAPATLKRFSAQAGGRLLYPSTAVAGVKTRAVKGEFTAHEALERMLDGSGLTAVVDRQNGAISLVSGNDPNKPRTPLRNPSDRPGQNKNNGSTGLRSADEVVVLSPFEVTPTDDDEIGYVSKSSIGATRTKTPLLELPQSMQVFNERFITDTAATDTWSVISYSATATGGDRRDDVTSGTGTSVRGYNLSRRVDGIEMPWAPMSRVDPAAYERIELVKSSSSVLFGTTAPGGVINYITKKPSLKPATSLSLRAGSYDFYKAVFDSTGPVRKANGFSLAYRLIATYEDSRSMRDFERIISAYVAGTLEARLRGATMIRVRYEDQNTQRTDALQSIYLWESTPAVTNPPGGIPIAAPGLVLNLPDHFSRGEPTDFQDTKVRRLDATLEHWMSAAWVFRAIGSDTRYSRDGDWTAAIAQTNLFPYYARQLFDRHDYSRIKSFDASLLGDFTTGPVQHRLLLGYSRAHTLLTEAGENYAALADFNLLEPEYHVTFAPTPLSSFDRSRDVHTWAYFIQDQSKWLGDRLQFTMGLRRDAYDPKVFESVGGSRSRLQQQKGSPRYSALYRVTDGLSVYYSYSETFQPATGTQADGTPLDAPTTKVREIGIKTDFFDHRITGSLAAFRAVLGNQKRSDPINAGEILQTSFESRGVELSLTYQPFPNFQLLPSIGYLETEITRNESLPSTVGNRLGSMPKWTAAFWSRYDFKCGPKRQFSLGLGVRHQADRFESDNNRYRVPDYTVVSALFRYSWGKYALSINADNLADRHYVSQLNGGRTTFFGESRRIFSTLTILF